MTVCFATLGVGTGQSWTSPALPHLKSNMSEIPISDNEGAKIASFFDLGLIIGNLITPVFSSFMGRKYCLMTFTIPQVISWVLILFANNILTLFLARVIGGISSTLAFSYTIMYIGEIAEENIRGILLLIMRIYIETGFLIPKIAGVFCSYRTINIIMLFIPLLFFVTFFFIPESPYYLLLQNREEEAIKTIKRLRGTDSPEIVNSELKRIQKSVKNCQDNKKWAFRELFFVRGHRRSLFIVVTICWTKYLAGKMTIDAYTQEIFSYIDFSIPPNQAALMFASFTIFCLLIFTQIVERVGRRKIVLFSGTFAALGLGIVGSFFFLNNYLKANITSIAWLPFAGLMFYNISVNLGFGSLTSVLMGEMFALNVKVTAITCLTVSTDVIMFLIKLMFQWMNETFDIYTTFWMYSIFCLIGTLVFFFITPETKGKTLEEIQDVLHSRKNLNVK